MARILKFLKRNRGITSIEYCLIAVGVSVAIVIVVKVLGGNLSDLYKGLTGITSGGS